MMVRIYIRNQVIFSTGKYSYEYTHLLYYIDTYVYVYDYGLLWYIYTLYIILRDYYYWKRNRSAITVSIRVEVPNPNGMLALKSPGDTLLLCNV